MTNSKSIQVKIKICFEILLGFFWIFLKWFFSAHDTEKEEKDDFAGHGAIIDLRPGQNVSDDEDEDEPKKIKKKKKQKKPIEEDSSDTSNKSTRRTRPSSMPGW